MIAQVLTFDICARKHAGECKNFCFKSNRFILASIPHFFLFLLFFLFHLFKST